MVINADKYHTFAFVYIFYEIMSFSCIVFAVFLMCERTHRRLSNSLLLGIRFIGDELNSLPDSYLSEHETTNLLLELSVDPVVPATGWGVYALNKHLILSFLGSVVPFSVMVITGVLQTRVDIDMMTKL